MTTTYQTEVARPALATREEWLAARLELLAREKEHSRQRDALNAARRRLPMVRIEKGYLFEGAAGWPRASGEWPLHRDRYGETEAAAACCDSLAGEVERQQL